MPEPVTRKYYPNPYYEPLEEATDPIVEESTPPVNQRENSAEAEVASLYYQSSISSLAETPPPAAIDKSTSKIQEKPVEKSWFSKTKDWLWGLVGWGKKPPAAADVSDDPERSPVAAADDSAPRLEPPTSTHDGKRLAKSLMDVNRDLVYRLKDIAEFSEEMLKSHSRKLDKLIFLELIYSSLYQKKLKEIGGVEAHEELLRLHQNNKALQKHYYDLFKENLSRAETKKYLTWVNLGLTAGIVGALAATFATGGAAAILIGGAGISLMSFGKAGTTLTGGIITHKNNHNKGEMYMINLDAKVNSGHIQDELGNIQSAHEDIAMLLKMIRQHLDNQTQAERANFKR